jgi:hypothetical protein
VLVSIHRTSYVRSVAFRDGGEFAALSDDALLYSLRFADIRRVNLPVFHYGVFYFVADESVVGLKSCTPRATVRRSCAVAVSFMAEITYRMGGRIFRLF